MAVIESFDGTILLTTLWNQNGIIKCGDNQTIEFNCYSPVDPIVKVNSYTGCVNTAMGQIIYYFLENELISNFNLTLTASDDFVSTGTDPDRAIVITQAGGGAAGTPSFSEINEVLSVFVPEPVDPTDAGYSADSVAAAKFVAALNFACGVVNRSMYSYLTGTAAVPDVSVYERCGFTSCLNVEAFSYRERERWIHMEVVDGQLNTRMTDELLEVFIENLLDGRPIYLAISGHAIVLDGYDSANDMFHINYGWGDEGGGPGGSEGTAAHTKWYTRDEFQALNIVFFQAELHTSRIETFTVSDGRFYGIGTFLRAVEQANAMQGGNVISFTGESTSGSVIEIPYTYKFKDEISIRGFDLTIFGEIPAGGDESQNEAMMAKTLFAGEVNSDVRFENFSGNALLQTSQAKRGTIFDFANSLCSELFFCGAKFYSGKYAETIDNAGLFQQLTEEKAAAIFNNTENSYVIVGSCSDDTVKFDQKSISVGDIDLDDGYNVLIVADGSRIFGDISGGGANNIFIDSTANITGALRNECALYFEIGEVNSDAIFTVTGDAAETFQKIAVLTIDASGAAAGEHIIFSCNSLTADLFDALTPKIIGNGTLAVKDDNVVLTVADDAVLLTCPEDWTPVAELDGNEVTLNWAALASAAGYSVRYAGDAEALAGSGSETTTNSKDLLLNNGTWYVQVRAFDEQGKFSGWSEITEIVINNTVETVTTSYLANGNLTDQEIGSAFTVFSGGVLCNAEVTGSLTLEKGSITTGFLSIAENASVDVFSGAAFIFDAASLDAGNTQGLIDNYAALNGTFRFGISVSADQAEGIYVLAENIAEWEYSLKINVMADGALLGSFEDDKLEFVYGDKAYRLEHSKDEQQLQLVVENAVSVSAGENGSTRLRWHAPSGATGYIFEISGDESFSARRNLITRTNELNIITPLPQNYSWRVMTVGYESEFTPGVEIEAAEVSGDAQIYTGESNIKSTNLFAAASCGVWGRRHVARNMAAENWAEDIADVALHGKNRYQDIFQGGVAEDCSNIILLSDDSNGDAFFVDDIFTSFPDEQARGRFTEISEIYAGAGDDIIDMTSSRFVSENDKIIIHGGDGDDVLWSNSGSFLFGDRGNDTIVGSSGQDHISGGTGDDYLHGGGGKDYFLYTTPDTWGNDVIHQLEDGSVNIVFYGDGTFMEKYNITFEYDSETNTSVFRHESGTITICDYKFDLSTNLVNCRIYSDFDLAFAAGGFDAFSSGKVFEDADSGILA